MKEIVRSVIERFFTAMHRISFIRRLAISFVQLTFWRDRRVRRYLDITEKPALQIGCGKNVLSGWLNSDISLKDSRSGIYMDAGKPFPLPDSSFDYVYSEHLFEHLTYQQAQNMLKESYRVLKPGGVIRIATPDLQFLMRLYQEPEKPIHKDYMAYSVKDSEIPATPVYVINKFHTSWRHQIIYDRETLSEALETVGFKNPIPCDVGKSQHAVLSGIEGHFKLMPYEFNLLETMVVEATK